MRAPFREMTMEIVEEFTQWIVKLGRGDPRAAEVLWAQYFGKLVQYARRKLDGLPCRIADEEDVALSAMNSFCQGMAKQRFDEVNDREDLWKLLVTITARKACAQRRHQFAAKRDARIARGESAFLRADSTDQSARDAGIGEVIGTEPTPEFACMVAEDCRQLLDRLGDENLRQVAQLTLEGHTTAEIADRIGRSQRSVQRKLDTIREIWSAESPQ
jgi:DNA-directed RNA polymerase specialized sigma24 family protein